MANVLAADKQIAIIGSLCEGSSIRSIERLTGVHPDTIMRLGVKVGTGCSALMDARMRDLSCIRLEMDEIWGFVGKKENHVRTDDDPKMGDVWTFCAIDADTKLVPAFKVGKRDGATANAFVKDVAGRMNNRLQISTDGWEGDGIVEVFRLKGPPKADTVYAWVHDPDDPEKPKRHVTVLHLPPVISSKTAGQAAIVQEYKDRAKTN